MGDAARAQAEREAVLEQVRSEDWPEHVAALYEEIAALSTALGMPTPRLRAAGLDPAGAGSLLASLQQMGAAMKQIQEIATVNEARTRALLSSMCQAMPGLAPQFRAVFEQASDVARQQATDPDKRRPTKPILVH